jgi:hypothetical protein
MQFTPSGPNHFSKSPGLVKAAYTRFGGALKFRVMRSTGF